MSKNYQWQGGYTGGQYNGTGYGTYVGKSCSHPPKPVKVGQHEIYATARRTVQPHQLDAFDVVCPLVTHGGEDYVKYTGLLLWFPIKDYTATHPYRLRTHAERLLEFMRNGCKVLTFCEGSHGRTGMVLATLIALAEPDVDPIDEVRSRHCSHACETQDQIEAVFLAAGVPIPDKWKPKPKADTVVKHDTFTQGTLAAVTTFMTKEVQTDMHGRSKLSIDPDPTKPEGLSPLASSAAVVTELPGKVTGPTTVSSSTTTTKTSTTSSQLASGGHLTPSQLEQYRQAINGMTPTEKTEALDELGLTESELNFALERSRQDAQTVATVELADVEREALLERNAPFYDQWSKNQRRKFRGVQNARTPHGDYLCEFCEKLIVDPLETRVLVAKFKNQKEGKYAVHTDCTAAQMIEDDLIQELLAEEAALDEEDQEAERRLTQTGEILEPTNENVWDETLSKIAE